ncbi:conserved hypothetical protein [Xanthomonas citri pv. fuscans]|nr:conserved hypothetical protein [Xanthomonas citri pv. fuscans]
MCCCTRSCPHPPFGHLPPQAEEGSRLLFFVRLRRRWRETPHEGHPNERSPHHPNR